MRSVGKQKNCMPVQNARTSVPTKINIFLMASNKKVTFSRFLIREIYRYIYIFIVCATFDRFKPFFRRCVYINSFKLWLLWCSSIVYGRLEGKKARYDSRRNVFECFRCNILVGVRVVYIRYACVGYTTLRCTYTIATWQFIPIWASTSSNEEEKTT